jgi:hypothetical protein
MKRILWRLLISALLLLSFTGHALAQSQSHGPSGPFANVSALIEAWRQAVGASRNMLYLDGQVVYSATGFAPPAIGEYVSCANGEIRRDDCTSHSLPSVQVMNPREGFAFEPPIRFPIDVTVINANGQVSRVDLIRNNEFVASDTSEPYSFLQENLAIGTYEYVIRAYLNNGQTVEAARSIVVVPQTPDIVIVQEPAPGCYWHCELRLQWKAPAMHSLWVTHSGSGQGYFISSVPGFAILGNGQLGREATIYIRNDQTQDIVKAITYRLRPASTSFGKTWLRCDSCTPDQFLQKAQDNNTIEELVVYDPVFSRGAAFRNSSSCRATSCFTTTEVRLEQEEINMINALGQSYLETNGTMKFRIEVPFAALGMSTGPVSGTSGSAYDFVNNAGYARDLTSNLLRQMQSGQHLSSNAHFLVTGAAFINFAGEDPTFTIKVTFPDGTATFLDWEIDALDALMYRTSTTASGGELRPVGDLRNWIGSHQFDNQFEFQGWMRSMLLFGTHMCLHSEPYNAATCTWVPASGNQQAGTLTCSIPPWGGGISNLRRCR